MLFSVKLRGFVGSDRCCFAASATVNLADVSDHQDLHRHDLQLFADFFADSVFAATANTGQFVFGEFVGDLNAWQVSRQWLALATARTEGYNLFVIFRCCQLDTFRLIEQGQLRCLRIRSLPGLAPEQTVAQ